MKTWKEELLSTLNAKAKEQRIIYFREEVAIPAGFSHVGTKDVKDIVARFLKDNPDYEAKHDISNPTNSLFCGLILCEKGFLN